MNFQDFHEISLIKWGGASRYLPTNPSRKKCSRRRKRASAHQKSSEKVPQGPFPNFSGARWRVCGAGNTFYVTYESP